MTKKLNVIFICNEIPPGNTGGIGTFVNELTKGLTSHGHKLFIVGFLDDNAKKETINVNGVNVIRIPSKTGLIGMILNRYYLYKEINSICAKYPIDIIEVPDFEGWAAFLPKGTHKIVVRLHGSHTYFANEMDETPSMLIKTLEKVALKRANAIVSVSRYTADKTLKLFSLNRDIHVIHNGIDLPDINKCKSDWSGAHKIVFTGTLMKKKGVFAIAKAWPLVKEAIPNAQLIMIGKDTVHMGESAKSKIKKIAKDDSILFLGHLSKNKMEDVVVGCDIAIYPSYSETFGLAPIEAMSLGVPTIYTKLSCGPEIVKIKRLVDICVNPNNTLEVANNLIKLLKDKNYRCDIAKLGRQLVEENYSNDSKIIENESFYKEILKNA